MPAPLRHVPRKLGGYIVDRFYGIESEGWYQLDPADQSRTRYGDGIMYQTCPYAVLWALLRLLPINPQDVFFDLGCGKGRAVFVFSQSGLFQKCVGVELVPKLAEIARRNVSRSSSNTAVEIVTADVVDADLSSGTVFFFFNPFGVETIKAVLNNIEKNRNGRRILVACFGLYQRNTYDTCPWLVPLEVAGRVGVWKSISPKKPEDTN